MTHFTVAESTLPAYSHAFSRSLSIDELRSRTPAVFADTAAACTKPTYRFINKCGDYRYVAVYVSDLPDPEN